MASGRRLAVLVVALALVGAPAVALRAFCVGNSCTQDEAAETAEVPFCPLPAALREQIVAGYRQGRSPDVMGATSSTPITTDAGGIWVSWPSTSAQDARVPVVFSGVGVRRNDLPDGTGLDQIAPTLERILGFTRPHAQVRAGIAVDGVASGARPRLVVLIAWKGVGSVDLEAKPNAWKFLGDVMDRGASTMEGSAGSLPLDPSSTLTTIGTGALPSQHGVTGTLLRTDGGDVVPAWSDGAPPSVVSTFAEDLDRALRERPMVGLIAQAATDRGLIGGGWYLDHDRDDVHIGGDPVTELQALLDSGYGQDDVPDLLAVSLGGPIAKMSRTSRAIAFWVRRSSIPTTLVVAGTGSAWEHTPSTIADDIDAAMGAPVVAAEVPGGFFLDRGVMTANEITSDDVVKAMDTLTVPGSGRLFADAYPGFAVSFSRFC